jgi:hypothetical protein
MFLKILMPVFMLGITLSTIFWGRHWKDEKRKSLKIIIIFCAVALTLVNIWVIYNDSQDNKILLGKVSGLDKVLETESKTAKERDLDAKKDRVKLQDELTVIKSKLEPFVQIAQIRYPGIDADLALKKLAQEVDLLKNKAERIETRTEELASREVYRPLVSLLKEKVIADFKMIKEKYNERNLHVKLMFEGGNRNRQFISRDLAELFRLSEIKAEGPTSAITFPSKGGILPAAEMSHHPEDIDLAKDLAKSINGFIGVMFQGKKDNKLEKGTVLIHFYGNPQFSQEGVVVLK